MNTKEQEELQQDFLEKFELTQKHNKSFREHIIQLFNEKGVTLENVDEKIGLSETMYRKLIRKDYMPAMKTVISICVGLELDVGMANTLLDALAVGFNRTNKRDYAYQYILTNYTGVPISVCNEVLEVLGLHERDLLGSQSIK